MSSSEDIALRSLSLLSQLKQKSLEEFLVRCQTNDQDLMISLFGFNRGTNSCRPEAASEV
jgi:hypothetical protein